MKLTKAFVSAILGGIAISLSSLAYIVANGPSLLATFLFSSGFFAVAIFNFDLFTDGIGSLFDNGSATHNFKKFGITLLGNILGAFLTGVIVKFNLDKTVIDAAYRIYYSNYKNLDFSFFISAILAGMLIFLALHGYRKAGGGFVSGAILIFTVALIPTCNFEYTIFNTFLIPLSLDTVAKYADQFFNCFFIIVISAVGNALGAMIISLLYRYKEKEIDLTHGLKKLKQEKEARDRRKRAKKAEERRHHHSRSSINEKDYAEFEEFKRFKREMQKREKLENEKTDEQSETEA